MLVGWQLDVYIKKSSDRSSVVSNGLKTRIEVKIKNIGNLISLQTVKGLCLWIFALILALSSLSALVIIEDQPEDSLLQKFFHPSSNLMLELFLTDTFVITLVICKFYFDVGCSYYIKRIWLCPHTWRYRYRKCGHMTTQYQL